MRSIAGARMQQQRRRASGVRSAESREPAPGLSGGGVAAEVEISVATEISGLGGWIERWRDYLGVVEGKRTKTVKAYVAAVAHLVADLELAAPGEISRAAIERHVKRRVIAGAGPATVRRIVISSRLFCRYLLAHGAIAENPAIGIASPKTYRSTTPILSEGEVSRLLFGERKDEVLPRDPKLLVSVVMFALAYGGALRPDELGPLQLGDVAWVEDGGWFAVTIRKAKHAGGDQVQLIGKRASRLLGAYLSQRAQLGPGPFLFPCRPGAAMSEKTVVRRFAELCRLRGIEPKGRDLVPKLLRKSRCTHLLEGRARRGGAPIHWVQAFMRHKDPETTIRHYALVAEHHVSALLRRFDDGGSTRRALPLGGVMRDLAAGVAALGVN